MEKALDRALNKSSRNFKRSSFIRSPEILCLKSYVLTHYKERDKSYNGSLTIISIYDYLVKFDAMLSREIKSECIETRTK